MTAALFGVVVLATAPFSARAKDSGPIYLAMSNEVRGMCEQAQQLINAQRVNDAIRLLERARSMDPNCAEVHGYLGLAYQNSRNPRQAIAEYQQALNLSPQMSFINVNIGNCYLNLDQPDQAVPYFERYLAENPNAPDAAQVRMSIQQAGSRKGQQNLRTVMEQGQSLLRSGRANEARRAFEQAVSIQPDFAPAHFFLGYALAQSGGHQQAITEFQTALRLDPSMKEAVLNIGSNYQSLGDSASAISWYQRYLAENPGSPKAGDIRKRISGLQEQAAKQRGGQRPPPQAAAMGGSSAPPPLAAGDDPYAGMDIPGQPAAPAQPPAQAPAQSPFGATPAYGAAPGGYGGAPASAPQTAYGAPQSFAPQGGYAQPQTAYGTSAATQNPATAASPTQDDYMDNVVSGGKYFRWPVEKLPIRVFIAPGQASLGYRDSFRQALQDSFAVWAKGSENRLAFWMVQDPAQADIVCDWTGDPNKVQEGGKSVEGGLAKLSGQEQPNGVDVKVVRARITILTKPRGDAPLTDADMKKVCLHEIGHALGLNGHSNDNHDVMFFSESPSVWPALSKRDKATIRRLYSNYPKTIELQSGQ